MTTNYETITFIIGVGGILITIYRYFRDPDEVADKSIALLAQRIEDSQTGTDRRFKDVQDRFDAMNETFHDHIKNESQRIESMQVMQMSHGKDLVRITTILEERLPAKNKSNG